MSSDYGKDLASVQALQRKHEGFMVCGCVCGWVDECVCV